MGNYDNPLDLSPNDIYWRVRQMKAAEEVRWKQDLRAIEMEAARHSANVAANPPASVRVAPLKVKKNRRLLLCGT